MATIETKHTWLDDPAFYETCQAYRHAGITQQDIVAERFEELKAFIREQSDEENETLRQQNAELVKALKIAHAALLHANRNGWTQKNDVFGAINEVLFKVQP